MTISRRDTIIIAVLVNIGLLAALFMTAMQMEDDPIFDHPEITIPIAEAPVEYHTPEPVVIAPIDEMDQVISTMTPKPEEKVGESQPNYLEITVKRGDALEKIARANGTTIKEIKRINKLNNDTLTIGKTLKVPVVDIQPQDTLATPESEDGTYYVLKSGDNPWKIARRFHVKYDDILTLNDLDEDNAKKLKPGDKIRVK